MGEIDRLRRDTASSFHRTDLRPSTAGGPLLAARARRRRAPLLLVVLRIADGGGAVPPPRRPPPPPRADSRVARYSRTCSLAADTRRKRAREVDTTQKPGVIGRWRAANSDDEKWVVTLIQQACVWRSHFFGRTSQRVTISQMST